MKRLITILFLSLLIYPSIHAEENFSEMSTQELIAIMGYVNDNEKSKFVNEIKSRVSYMSQNEKKKYDKNIDKLK